jgi:RNA polymerase sigma-70 factor (ECF subfamily)
MASSLLASPQGPLESLLDRGSTTGFSDAQLVELLNQAQGEDRDLAFRALVERHGRLVWGTCRRFLQQTQDAEDAFQATFLILMQKAATLRVRGSLGPWLYQVALHAAQQARKSQRRQRAVWSSELEIIEQPATEASIPDERLALLQQVLSGLTPRYRLPIVLCHLEGRTHEEAARLLQCPTGTVSGRLSRGRALLRSRLRRRGWTSDDKTIHRAILTITSTTTPCRLLGDCLRAARQIATLGYPASPAHQLMKGAMAIMLWNRTKRFLASALLLSISIMAAGEWLRVSLASQPDDRPDAKAKLRLAAAARSPVAEPQGRVAQQSTGTADEVTLEHVPPVVVRCVPEAGSSDVDPGLKEISVTFSKAMTDKSWSWTTLSISSFPNLNGDPRYLADGRTCVLPVKLEPGRTYATWLNSSRFQNFKDKSGHSSVPYLLVFRTRK